MTTGTTQRTRRLRDGASVLTFTRADDACPDGAYQCRGGICWPIVTDKSSCIMRGFALMAGMHLETRRVYVLGQREFVAVDHVQDDDGTIRFEGLSTWLVDCWARWFADTFAWRQPYETNRRYLLQVLQSAAVQPKPHLIELDWADDDDARGAVYEAEATGMVRYPADSPLHRALLEFSVAPPEARGRFPEVHALTCALFALQQFRVKGVRHG